MANSVPVVTTRCGALPDAVGDAGVLVDEEDIEGLVHAIADMIYDSHRREAFTGAGRARVLEQFSTDAVAEKTVAFWQDLGQP